jgi:hypothetical protein
MQGNERSRIRLFVKRIQRRVVGSNSVISQKIVLFITTSVTSYPTRDLVIFLDP